MSLFQSLRPTIFFPVFFLLLASYQVLASDQTKARQLLQQQMVALGNFEASYEQSLSNNRGQILEESRGKVYFSKDKKFRNNVEFPYQMDTVSDGMNLWMVDYDLEQVSISFLDDYLKASPLAILLFSGNEVDAVPDVLNQFHVTLLTQDKRQQNLFKLLPADKQSVFKELRFGIRRDNLAYIELDERNGNRVRLTFNNNKRVSVFPESLFEVIIPDAFDVVDERAMEREAQTSSPADMSKQHVR